MKKTLKQVLMFVAFMAAPVTMNAQLNEGKTIPEDFGWICVPKAFSYDGVTYLCGRKRDNANKTTTLNIYNDELKAIKSLIIPSRDVDSGILIDFDNNSTTDFSFYASQTLFNADERFEYVLPLYENPEVEYPKTIGFRIMSEDGTELQSVRFDAEADYWDDDFSILKINEKYYLVFNGEYEDPNGGYNVVTIFYRINPQSTEIKAVANIPASFVGNYSLDGRRQGKMQRGVNILRESDGTAKKVLVK